MELTFNLQNGSWHLTTNKLKDFGIMSYTDLYSGDVIGLIRLWRSYGFRVSELKNAVSAMIEVEKDRAIFSAYGCYLGLEK